MLDRMLGRFMQMSEVRRILVVTVAALLAAVVSSCSSGDAGEGGFNSNLRAELLGMAELDDELRSQLTAENMQDTELMSELLDELLAREVKFAARMGEILDEFGWPDVDMVRSDGAESAWVLVRHGDIDLQARALELMKQSENPGVAEVDVAEATDRVLVARGEPQLYGTQFRQVNGRLMQEPFDNADSVDARRVRLGLPPMDAYLQMLERAHGGVGQPTNPQPGQGGARPDSADAS